MSAPSEGPRPQSQPPALDAADAADAVAHRFAAVHARPADGVWAAPGRVNLIGEHTDYNHGLALPFALPQRVHVAAAARSDGRIRAASVQAPGMLDADVGDLAFQRVAGWVSYVAGAVWAVRLAGVPVTGADLLVDGDVPLGAGLASSAALTCAVAGALVDLGGAELAPLALARAAQRAENEYVGAPTGLLDQLASVLGAPGQACLLDLRSLEDRPVPFDVRAAGLSLLVIDTGVRHDHADGRYGERRRQCEEAAARLGVSSLRELNDPDDDRSGPGATFADRLDRLDPTLRRRVHHVVTENERVLAAATVLDAGEWSALGALLSASHRSLRDDFEVSCPELDVAVSTARAAGALGARMTGGGFGGSAIALVPADRRVAVGDDVTAAYGEQGWAPPTFLSVVASGGAGRVR